MLEFIKLEDDARLPERQTAGAAGHDIYAYKDVIVEPRGQAVVPTGVSARFSKDVALKVQSRSGLAFKKQIEAFHGLIDSDYHPGEICILLFNRGNVRRQIRVGDRIAQLVAHPIIVSGDADGDRAGNGFGSTGT